MPPSTEHLYVSALRGARTLALKESSNPQMPAARKQASTVQRERREDRAKGQLTQKRIEQRATRNSFPEVTPRPVLEVGN